MEEEVEQDVEREAVRLEGLVDPRQDRLPIRCSADDLEHSEDYTRGSPPVAIHRSCRRSQASIRMRLDVDRRGDLCVLFA